MLEVIKFGVLMNGDNVNLYKITNSKGNYVEFIDYGCKIKSIVVTDKSGKAADVCLGYDTLEEYERDKCFLGTAVGRYANRIANSSFAINGVTYNVDANEGRNHLHGGFKNFANCMWSVLNQGENFVTFTNEFPDMQGGYPGNLKVNITYTWNDSNVLEIAYKAKSDKDTILNLTNHSYFNLSGDCKSDILDHDLKIYTDKYTPTDEEWIPNGSIESVSGTPFDFVEFHKIGERINDDNDQLKIGKGYDHNYVFGSFEDKLMAEVKCDRSGIVMKCYSTEPGMQLYSGNNLLVMNESVGKFPLRSGFCLESQNYPNSPNCKYFPSPVLKAGDEYTSVTKYEFDVV